MSHHALLSLQPHVQLKREQLQQQLAADLGRRQPAQLEVVSACIISGVESRLVPWHSSVQQQTDFADGKQACQNGLVGGESLYVHCQFSLILEGGSCSEKCR